jgi:hypothetical protein
VPDVSVLGAAVTASALCLLAGAMLAFACGLVVLRYQYAIPSVPDFSVYLPPGGTEYIFLTAMFGVPAAIVWAWF